MSKFYGSDDGYDYSRDNQDGYVDEFLKSLDRDRQSKVVKHPEGCSDLVSDCCYSYLPQEYGTRVGEIVICPDCLDHCEVMSL